MENMQLWNSVCETDPAYTKGVSFGKYKFTDIDSMWNIRRATELWGPYGSTWGLTKFRVTQLYGTDEAVVGLVVHGEFKYPDGQFEIGADMPYDPKGETLKKLQTMCIGKALSRLGFSADVYMGRFDDSAYVSEMEKKYASGSDSTQLDTTPSGASVKVKAPEPSKEEAHILGLIANKYDRMKADGNIVDLKKVCEQVYFHFGKYPSKEKSVDTVVATIPVEAVTKANDFLEGV